MAQAYDVEKKNLPQVLGCQKNVINNWGYYGRIPFDHLYQCVETTGVSMDWLLHGKQLQSKITETQLASLQSLAQQLINDGLDFNMIAEAYPGAKNQLLAKLEKDLTTWAHRNESENLED